MTDADAVPLDKRIDEAVALNAIAQVDRDGFSHLGAPAKAGAPIVHVKDNIAVRNMFWTAGSPLFADVRAERDAVGVQLLRHGGANIAFKTTLHELALGVTGANRWTGAIANPHNPDHVAGGSSGGAAVALALGLGDLALVTDTGGSARIPASFCGVFGFRPSTGRYPGDGIINLSPSRDTLGLMARDMEWLLWGDAILAGTVEEAAYAPRPLRIGIVSNEELGATGPEIGDAYAAFGRLAEAAGHELVEVDLGEVFAQNDACGLTIAMYETRGSLEASARALARSSYGDLLAAIATPEVAAILSHFAEGANAVTREAYVHAVDHEWPALQKAFAALFGDRIDILCLPTVPVTAPLVGCGDEIDVGDRPLSTFPTLSRYTQPDSMAGLPSLSIPFGYDKRGLPIGIMVSAARYNDASLLGFAHNFVRLAGYPTAPSVQF